MLWQKSIGIRGLSIRFSRTVCAELGLKDLFYFPEIRVWVKEIEVMKLQHNRHAAENLTPYADL